MWIHVPVSWAVSGYVFLASQQKLLTSFWEKNEHSMVQVWPDGAYYKANWIGGWVMGELKWLGMLDDFFFVPC